MFQPFHDDGTRLSHHTFECIIALFCVEGLSRGVLNGLGVLAVPDDGTYRNFFVVAIHGRRGHQTAGTVNEAVTTFPDDLVDVVGDAHLAVKNRWQHVVERAPVVVLEVEHGHLVLVAIVETDGAAVAEPDAVAARHEEAYLVCPHFVCFHVVAYHLFVAG